VADNSEETSMSGKLMFGGLLAVAVMALSSGTASAQHYHHGGGYYGGGYYGGGYRPVVYAPVYRPVVYTTPVYTSPFPAYNSGFGFSGPVYGGYSSGFGYNTLNLGIYRPGFAGNFGFVIR